MTPKYFMYFPGNYRWSAAFVNMLGRAAYGGADISELHKIGRALAGKAAEDDEAWFDACVSVADEVRGHAERFVASRAPCVVFFDGLDVTKEIQYLAGVPDLIKRGISVLVMDGPGTGEAIRFRGLVLRHDYEKAGSACIDFLEQRDDVDGKKIGIVAISLGGYYAPRCAALEPRFAACIAWGAIWDYHAVWKHRIEAQFKASLSVPGHHIMWILGAATLKDALKRLEPFNLDGVVQKMRCPFLVVHGEDDEQIPLSDARALYDACGSNDKTLRVFTSEEGGAQHCQRDYLTLGCATMWNWFEEKLLRA